MLHLLNFFLRAFDFPSVRPRVSGGRRSRSCSRLLPGILLGCIGASLSTPTLGDEGQPSCPGPIGTAPWSFVTDPRVQFTLADEEFERVAGVSWREERRFAIAVARTEHLDLSPAPDQLALSETEYFRPVAAEESAVPRRLRYMVQFSVRTVFDDNINLSKFDRKSDLYTSIEPVINLGLGNPDNNYVTLTYAPSVYLFANHPENDAVQHMISLGAQYRWPQLTLNLSQNVQILDGTGLNSLSGTGTDFTRTNLDVSGRTRLNIYTTRLDANYSLTGKTFLTGGIGYSISDYATLISSSVISANAYFNYTYSPKLSIGLGVAGGYDMVGSPSQDQTYEQLNVRASYEVTGKVSASVTAGFEFRQVSNGGSDNGSPVFDATVFYQPFDGTSLALTFSRRTQNSATLGGQNLHSTSVIVSARQRLLQRIFLGLSAGYENSSYFATASGIASTRSDDYFFIQASVDVNITSYWTAGVYYYHRESTSSFDVFSFYDNQIGFRTALNF